MHIQTNMDIFTFIIIFNTKGNFVYILFCCLFRLMYFGGGGILVDRANPSLLQCVNVNSPGCMKSRPQCTLLHVFPYEPTPG